MADQITHMQEDIHKLQKMVHVLFDKIEDDKCEASDVYADKDKLVELINRLCTKMGDANMLELTISPAKDIGQDQIQELKERISKLQAERQNLQRRTAACVKGIY